MISQYELEPFELNVQTAERTLVDKLYALGDYYLTDSVKEHSRHIYDIYKLCEIVNIDDNIKSLIIEVYKDRKPHELCHSAKDGIDMNSLLHEVIDKAVYKKDYENITEKMLFEKATYETAIKALQTIVNYKLF